LLAGLQLIEVTAGLAAFYTWGRLRH